MDERGGLEVGLKGSRFPLGMDLFPGTVGLLYASSPSLKWLNLALVSFWGLPPEMFLALLTTLRRPERQCVPISK